MIRLRTIFLLLFTILVVTGKLVNYLKNNNLFLANRVLLRDITTLTLNRGQSTTGRRASPVPQLQCVGGTAQGKFSPKTVQCYNRGFDGLNTQVSQYIVR